MDAPAPLDAADAPALLDAADALGWYPGQPEVGTGISVPTVLNKLQKARRGAEREAPRGGAAEPGGRALPRLATSAAAAVGIATRYSPTARCRSERGAARRRPPLTAGRRASKRPAL
jgi:hypothetical protein